MGRLELVKIVCVAVIAERDGDSIVGEQEGPSIACYSEAQLVAYRKQLLAEIGARNAELTPPNRATRRRAPRKKKPPAKT